MPRGFIVLACAALLAPLLSFLVAPRPAYGKTTGKVCNHSTVTITVMVKDSYASNDKPLLVDVKPGRCTKDSQEAVAVLGKQCKTGGMYCEVQAWKVADTSVKIVDGYPVPEIPGLILYVVEKKAAGKFVPLKNLGWKGEVHITGYGLSTAAMTEATLQKMQKMHEQDMDAVMQLAGGLIDGATCVEGVAMALSMGVTTPDHAAACGNVLMQITEILEKYAVDDPGEILPIGKAVLFKSALTGKCMDVSEGSKKDGADVIQWECHTDKNQQWVIAKSTRAGYYKIKNVLSSKCLGVANGATGNGSDIVQLTCANSDAQLWKIFPSPSWTYYGLKAYHSKRCADISGGSPGNGTDIIQWDCNEGDNQYWLILPREY